MGSLIILATLFVVGSVIGYLIEVLFRRFVSQKVWMNPGFMTGPYIPLYGFGVIFLYGLSNIGFSSSINGSLEVFIRIMIIGCSLTVIELIAGLIFIKGMHLKLWDYSDRWGNFKGLICPLFSFLWLIGGAIYYFFINEYLVNLLSWISENLIYTFFIGIIIGMILVDAAYSLHLGMKVKKAAGELSVRIEEFNDFVNKSNEKRGKLTFFRSGILRETNENLKDAIKKYYQSLPLPKKWWKKPKK